MTDEKATAREKHIALALEYFRRVDAGEPPTDMFTEDAQVFFPKFGTGRGLEDFARLGSGLMSEQVAFWHSLDSMTFTHEGDRLIVEGLERGRNAAGVEWPDERPELEGRYCNAFEFRGDKISRMHIYVDPDFLGQDVDRFLWASKR
ncbi:nuclear transport factor 2 family protein [Streptomyces sp. P6-2-1]|uniref:nuclear transport factor 2 family protein n=1 Tax=unclassified Streptomyces TaxID=2593676 RepID=UPI003D36BA7A